jgi:hypothetical protein
MKEEFCRDISVISFLWFLKEFFSILGTLISFDFAVSKSSKDGNVYEVISRIIPMLLIFLYILSLPRDSEE